KLKTVAAKKYPIYEIGDKIILRYRTSPERIVTVSGIYRKQTRSNVVVDALSIYKEDIINVGPSGKKEIQKFDKFAQKKKRSFYILRKRTNYKTSKIKYTEYIRDRIERIEHNKTNEINEKNGFIFNNRKWTTVENYLSSLIKTFKRKVRRGRLAKLKEKARLDIPKKKDGKDIVESVSAPETMLIADIRNSLNSENTVGSDTMLISDAKGKGQPEKTAEKKIEEKPEKKPKKKSKEKPKKKPEQKTKETPEPDIQEETGGSMGLIIGIIAGILIIAGGIALKLFVLTGDAGTSYYSLEEAKAKFWAQRIVNQTESPYAVFSFETKEQAKQAMLDLSFFKLNPINKEMQCKLSIEYGIHVSELDETRWIAFIGGVKLEHKDWSEAMEHWKEVAGQEEKSEEPHLGEQTQDELMEEFKKAREKKEKLSVSTKIEDDDISDLETSNIEEDDISDLETSDIEKR
ncbi:MAG: hypothetical protein U9O87_08060, partial [Verrucomicrobiota bacterium]|nr:hypothetical protein [Verrucomicrobiota bacterium]